MVAKEWDLRIGRDTEMPHPEFISHLGFPGYLRKLALVVSGRVPWRWINSIFS